MGERRDFVTVGLACVMVMSLVNLYSGYGNWNVRVK